MKPAALWKPRGLLLQRLTTERMVETQDIVCFALADMAYRCTNVKNQVEEVVYTYIINILELFKKNKTY